MDSLITGLLVFTAFLAFSIYRGLFQRKYIIYVNLKKHNGDDLTLVKNKKLAIKPSIGDRIALEDRFTDYPAEIIGILIGEEWIEIHCETTMNTEDHDVYSKELLNSGWRSINPYQLDQ